MGITWDTYHTKGTKSAYLFRYMKAKWVLKFMKTGYMSMARMDTFEDKLEGIAIGNISSIGLTKSMDFKGKGTPSRQRLRAVKVQLQKVQRVNYVCCWYLAKRESIAMWDLYGKEEGLAIQINRIALQTRVKKQLERNQFPPCAFRMVAGRVVYQNYIDVQPQALKYLAFRKDESFSHEKEYRFALSLKEPAPAFERYNYSLGNVLDLDFTIIASPRMSDEKFNVLQHELYRIDPKIKLNKSELDPWYQLMDLKT